MQIIGYSWTKRLPKTALADAIIAYVGAKDLEDLMRGYTTYREPTSRFRGVWSKKLFVIFWLVQAVRVRIMRHIQRTSTAPATESRIPPERK